MGGEKSKNCTFTNGLLVWAAVWKCFWQQQSLTKGNKPPLRFKLRHETWTLSKRYCF